MSRRPRQGMGRGRGAGCQPVPPAQGSPRTGVLAKPGFFPQQSVPSSSSRRAKLKARLQSKGHVSCLHSAEHTAKSGRVLYSPSGSSWRNSRGPCALVLKFPFGTCHLKQGGRRGWIRSTATASCPPGGFADAAGEELSPATCQPSPGWPRDRQHMCCARGERAGVPGWSWPQGQSCVCVRTRGGGWWHSLLGAGTSSSSMLSPGSTDGDRQPALLPAAVRTSPGVVGGDGKPGATLPR